MASSGFVAGTPRFDRLARLPTSSVRTRAARRFDQWAAFLLYVGLAVVHLGLGLTMSGPVVFADEGGYMGNAYYLATGKGLLYVGAPYHPGYSLLLVPLVQAFHNPIRAYQAALILNAFLLAGVGTGVFLLSRYFVGPERRGLRLAIAAVVASYPPFLAYTDLIIAMDLFIPLFILLCLALAGAFETDRARSWILVGFVAGALYVVHPIGMAVIIAVLVLVLGLPRLRRSWLRTALALMFGLQLSLLPGLALMADMLHATTSLKPSAALVAQPAKPGAPALSAAGSGPLTHAPPPTGAFRQAGAPTPGPPSAPAPATSLPPGPPGRVSAFSHQVSHELSIHSLMQLIHELAGQAFYLTVATYGLWILGLAMAAAAAWNVFRHKSRSVPDRLAVFVGLVTVLTLIASSAKFVGSAHTPVQADELIYGRFNEEVLGPVLVLGLTVLTRIRGRRRWEGLAWPAIIGTVIAITGIGLATGRPPGSLRHVIVDVNVMALHPLLRAFGGINVVAIGLIGFSAVAALVLLARWRGLTTAAVPIVVAGVLSASFSANRLSRDSDGRMTERVVLNAISLIQKKFHAPPSCIAYDTTDDDVWHTANDQFFLPRVRFRAFDSSRAERPCSELAITGRWDFARSYPGTRLMTPENFSPDKLWVLPGAVQDRLAAAGFLEPPGFPSALPASAAHSSIRLIGVGPGPRVLPFNRDRDLILAVTNTGTGAPWLSRFGFDTGAGGWVRLRAIWVARSNPLVPVAQDEADLPHTVYPGQIVDVTLRLVPTDLTGKPLPPGDYVVRVGLVQDGYTFFTRDGDQTVDLALTIGPTKARSA